MTCNHCRARNQFGRELGGGIVCLACGSSPGAMPRPVAPQAKTCPKGHPLPDGPPCFACIDHVGRSSPIANAIQRSGMRGAIQK